MTKSSGIARRRDCGAPRPASTLLQKPVTAAHFIVASAELPTFSVEPLASPLRRETANGAAAPVQADAPPSLAELYDSYGDFVYRTLLTLGVRPARADDALQDVFIVANRHLASFEGTFYRAWLFRLAHSVARNVRRSERRNDHAPLESVELIDQHASPFEWAARGEEIRLLHQLLELLDHDQREVFMLAELEQLAHVEIAAALGVHVNTVANRLRAARSRLEQLLRKHQQRSCLGRAG
jgi:RNA polymerase sigma-70 factor, ECF subfamily